MGTPGHALKSFGFLSKRPSVGREFCCGGAWMDRINGGTRMLPGRRVLSSVRSTNATQETKEAEVMKETVSGTALAGTRRKAWQAQEMRRRKARTARGGERTSRAHWYRTIRNISMMLTLLLWQRKRRRRALLRRTWSLPLEMRRARRSWRRQRKSWRGLRPQNRTGAVVY